MYRKYFLRTIAGFFCAMFLLSSCSSSGKVIKQLQAFSVTVYPGIIAVDENGKEMPVNSQTKYLVYAVTGSDKIKWDSAWVNGRAYTITAEKMSPTPVFEVGVEKLTGNKITIATSETEQLYLLHLSPVSTTKSTETELLRELLIRAVYKRKELNLSRHDIKELTAPDPV